MKKVLTLTTYNVYNYGAALQAYALQHFLISSGHDSELINYQPDYLRRRYDYKWVNPESRLSRTYVTRLLYICLKWLQRQTTLARKHSFDKFIHDYLRQTEEYNRYEDLAHNPPVADRYIVGSDQVWNTFYETGRDGAFYLDFVQSGDRISYAASFSHIEIDDIWKNFIKEKLLKFKAVSVREYHGLKILESMGIKGSWVLDPVFLLSANEWKTLMSPVKIKDKYILVYDFEGNKEIERFAKQYAKAKGLKIYSINDTYPKLYADKNYSNAGPREFLYLIYNSTAFVSNSFHGTAFSIIFNKPVFVFNRNRHKVNSRMESLMKLFGLYDCIINPRHNYADAIESCSFNWETIRQRLESEKEKSVAFIYEALK